MFCVSAARAPTLTTVNDWRDELIPPDDPRFQGAQFLNEDSRLWHTAQNSDYLRGKTWHWATWRERETVEYNPKTGEERPAVWDHDHCHFCYDTAFSVQWDDDLREGWTTAGPAGLPEEEQQPEYHWVCPECFERFRAQFEWSVDPADAARLTPPSPNES